MLDEIIRPRFAAPRSRTGVIRSRGQLPHLYWPGGTYFITFRLADAVLGAVVRTSRSAAARRSARRPIISAIRRE